MAENLDTFLARIKRQEADTYLQTGKVEQARARYVEACRLDPTHVRAWVMLGNLHSQLGAPDEAEAAYRQAIDRDPQRGEAYQFLGNLLTLQGRHAEAAACYRQALQIKPQSIPAHINLAATLALQGKLDEALEVYRSALQYDPDCRKAILGIAQAHERQGDFELAYQCLKPFIDKGDMDFEAAMIFTALARSLGHTDEAIGLLERLLEGERPRLDNDQRTAVHFRLGALYDAKGDTEAAFGHYRQGNDIKAHRWPFDPRSHADYVTATIETYTPAFTASAPRAAVRTERPVFIVGMPRSGTSRVEQILASHPAVFGAGELEEIPAIAGDLPALIGTGAPYPRCVQELTPGQCDTLARRYLDRLAQDAPEEAVRIIDKLPANFLHLGLISQLFPRARIIHCVRDPLDTCLSCYFQNFSPAYAYTFRLSHLGEFYRQYRRIMDHWGTVLEMPILEVRYEDLVNDQERISRALAEHCGLEWDERCLNFHQPRQPMYTRSVQRWRRYADQLAPLRSVLGGDDEDTLPPPVRQKDEAKSLLQRGNNEDAHALLTRLCAADPADAEGRYLLGRASAALGRVDEAIAHYRESLRGAPDNAALLKDLGDAFFGLERLEDAAACYRVLVEKQPTAYAHYSLANVYTRQQHLDEAVEHYRRALVLEPGRAEIYNNLGNALRYLGEYPQAADAYGKALALNPNHPMAHEGHANLGSALMLMGRPDEAGESFRRALALKPDAPRAVAGLADILEKQGCFQQAYDLMKPLLDAGKADTNMALVLAALCRPLDRCDEAIALMEAILADKQAWRLDVFEEITLHFMLGRLYDSAKEYDKAFPHFRTANGLSARRFDLEAYARYVDGIITAYSPDFMAHAPRADNRSQRPVFIVGMPRSGTSLVEQILASHPDVFGAGELEEMHRIVADLPHELGGQTPYPQCVSSLTPGACDKVAKRYLEYLDALSPGQSLRVTDKMPSNFLHLGLINLLFPEARIIHCVRDPLDTCLSCYFQNFVVLSYSHDLGLLGTYYRHYERLMAHWLPLLDVPVMEVRYEDIVANQEDMSRAIVEFCGLEWDDRCLQFHKTRRLVATASYDQVRQPMYSSSVGKWRHYAEHLEPLRQALGNNPTH